MEHDDAQRNYLIEITQFLKWEFSTKVSVKITFNNLSGILKYYLIN